ncbi:MAG: S-layer homology domain-containing protein [Clostridiales bacterium]|nr:S-layer homology domain-containing protein [Clostridiales bacterium]
MRKRRTKEKWLSIVVALAMVLGLLPSTAFAVGTDDRNETINVIVDFEGYNLGQGYYIQPTMLTLPAGATAADAAYVLLLQKGYEFKGSTNFLTSVKFGWREVAVPAYIQEDELWQTVYGDELGEAAEEDWIGAYDYSLMAGWMYTVNHAMGDALNEQLLSDGDVVRCQFSLWGYGLDLGIESDWGTGTPYYAHADKTGLIRAMFAEGAGEAAKKAALDVVINPLSTPAQVASALASLQNGGAKRPATLASLSTETINQPLINGYPGGILWKAGAAPDMLGTRNFATATKDYRVFYLPEITATSLSCAPTIATSWLSVSVGGDTVFAGHGLSGFQVSLTQAQTLVQIDVCTAETYEENGGFVIEDTYTISIEHLPVTQAEIDDIKIKTLSLTGGELLTPFEPDAAGMSIYVKAEDGAAVTYTFTAAAGTTAFKHMTSSTAANTLTPIDGAYLHTETASAPFLPSILLGYQTAIATARNVTVGGLSIPVRYQYKFMYNVGGAIEGGPDAVVDYVCPASQYTNNPAYGMNPERLLYGGLVSLGNFGGYITVRYDTPIKNSPNNKYGVDFKVNGNSNGGQGFSEPGNVWVSKDGEEWYLLAGSDYFDDNTVRSYEATYVRNPDGTASYRDNQGSKIAINPPGMYKYPLPANYPLYDWKSGEENEIAFKGPLLIGSASDPYGSSMAAFPDWGYVDVRDGDGTRNAVNPYAAGSGAGSSYDISWAVDEQGKPVHLDEISYIRVSTASHIYAGAIGEKSTEVSLIVSAESGASPVGTTAAPTSINVNGESVPIAEGQFTYEAAFGDSAVSVSVEGTEGKTLYVNNARGAARTYESPPTSGIIRVIVQEGDKEPLIYYIYNKASQTEPEEPQLVDGFYQIESAKDLAWFTDKVNGGETNISAKLVADIELDPSEDWTPIGEASANSFTGTFDGNGKTISGMSITINNGSGSLSDSYKGLFGHVGAAGTVKNFTVAGSTVSNSNSSASNAAYLGLVAGTSAGTISFVTVDNSTVVGKQNIGGIAGQNTGTVIGCANLGAAVTQTTINDNGIGGIVGANSGTVSYCLSNASVASLHDSDIDGYFGGIAGNNTGSGTIESCYNTGRIVRGYRSGGIAGVNSGSISNSYNTGSVNENGNSSRGGGIAVTGGAAENCYYLDASIATSTSYGTPKTAGELKAMAKELGGAFDPDFTENPVNGGYPILKWQNPGTDYCVTLSAAPANADVVFRLKGGAAIAPDAATGGTYVFTGLAAGTYEYAVSEDDGDYVQETGEIFVGYADVSKTVTLERRLYEAVFSVTPEGAMVSITDNGFEQSKAAADGTASFKLPMGQYAYAVDKFGYIGQTGAFTVSKGTGAAPVTVNLAESVKYNLTFNVEPASAVVAVSHSTDGMQTPASGSTYSLYEGNAYNYTVKCKGYVTQSGTVTIGAGDDAIDISLLEGITVWDGVTTEEPTLAGGVYQIADGEELAWFRDKVNSEIVIGSSASNSKSSDLSAVLLSDIDLGGNEWMPIGTYGQVSYSVVCGYTGIFDGNGFTISGLSVTTGTGGTGLFGTAFAGAVVKGLTVVGEIKSGQYCGGIAAYASAATITDCTSYVDITVTKAGSGRSFAGGIAGYMGDPNYYYTRTLIEHCVNYGAIDGLGDTNSWVGGIAGSASYGIGIKNCGNEGSVTGCDRVGGIVGDGALPVSGCYNTGSVASPTVGSSAGGIAGFANKLNDSCYNTGNVNGAGKAGGIVGELHSGYGGMIANCYSIGPVSSSGTGATDTSGAIAGYKGDDGTTGTDPKGATVANSYYLEGSVAAGIGYNAHAGDMAAAKSEPELKSLDMAAALGSAFASGGDQNNGYPILAWQNQAVVEPSPESVKITVAVADNEGYRFVMLPTEITVSEGKAAEYGYANAAPGHLVGGLDHGVYPGQVTALDALISAHELKYGEGFSPSAYLSGTSTSANLTKMFGISPYITFTVNNRPLVGSMSDGYAINEYALQDGDAVVFVRGTEDSWGMDYYSYFSQNRITVEAGELFELTLLGFDPMGQMAGLPGTPTPPLSVVPIPDAFIMLVNPDGTLGLLDETEDYSSGTQGIVQISISESGTYFISAVGMIENDWEMDVSTGLPICEVTVTEGGPVAPPASYETALDGALGWIRSNVAEPAVDSVGGEWAVLALARAGVNDDEWYGRYLAALDMSLASGSEIASWTDFERVTLALTALGIDASSYRGHDLTEPYKTYKPAAERPVGSRAINSDIFALIALDSKPYNGDAGQFLGAVLAAEKAGGGWGLSATAGIDITAMAIQAMAPFCDGDEAIADAVCRALEWLSSQEVPDAEGNAQIVVALAALGVDAADYDGKDYVSSLLAFYDAESGGFIRNGSVNMMATEQAACALVAYDRFVNGKNSLYDMSDAGGGAIVVPVNKSALNTAISSVPGSKGNYTDSSWNAMQSALAAAKIANDNPDATQAQVDSATAALLAAIAALATGGTGPSHQTMTVTFSLYGAPQHSGAPVYIWKTNSASFQGWIVNEKYTFEASQTTVFEVFERALGEYGFSACYMSRNNYVESISGPNGPIGEFSNGDNSGWMFMVNGTNAKVGLSDQTVKNGDTILWHYTDDYTQEEGASEWKPPAGPSGSGGGGAREEPGATAIGESETPLSGLVSAFADVKESDWFYGAVAYAVEKGLMNGTSATLFSPNASLTRAMLVTILYRNEGEPEFTAENPFSDVANGQWYTDAVIWAYENGIVSGYGNGLFGASDSITREQLVTMLHNYANWKELDTANSEDLTKYSDFGAVSAWASEAMAWAVAEGIISGRTETTLVPKGTATRAEAATMLMRFIEFWR